MKPLSIAVEEMYKERLQSFRNLKLKRKRKQKRSQ